MSSRKTLERRRSLPMADYDFVFKITVVGNVRVGKTSFIELFANNHTQKSYIPTVGLDFFSKSLKLEGRNYKLQLWDMSGQTRFRSLIPGYLKDAKGVFVIFDITDRETFESVEVWLEMAAQNCINTPIITLIGNKIDLAQDREVSEEEAMKFAEKNGIIYKEISARNQETLDDLVIHIAKELSGKFPQDCPMNVFNSNPATRVVKSPSVGPVQLMNDSTIKMLREKLRIRQASETHDTDE